MYGIVLTAVLATAGNGPVGQIYYDSGPGTLADLRRELEELRKVGMAQRIDSLKQTIGDLRMEVILQRLSELRREIEEVRRERGGPGGPGLGLRPPADRAVVVVQAPPGATLAVNDREFPLNAPQSSFITPRLQPGKDYHYNFKVNVSRDGKRASRSQRVTVRPGQVVRVSYDDMREGDDRK
jgi:uncharacterized protein (TIGR03000 family)